MRNLLKIGLILLAIVLGYFVYDSLMKPIRFERLKTERYAMGIDQLMKIRDAQVAYHEVHNKYVSTVDSLIPFIDTGKIYIIKRTPNTIYVKDERGIEVPKDIIEIDTVRDVPVKDSLFKNFDFKKLGQLEIKGKKINIELDTNRENLIPDSLQETVDPKWIYFFESKIKKVDLLHDADENNQLIARDQLGDIDGEYIKVGNLNESSTEGNWTEDYKAAVEELQN